MVQANRAKVQPPGRRAAMWIEKTWVAQGRPNAREVMQHYSDWVDWCRLVRELDQHHAGPGFMEDENTDEDEDEDE